MLLDELTDHNSYVTDSLSSARAQCHAVHDGLGGLAVKHSPHFPFLTGFSLGHVVPSNFLI